MSLIRRPMGEEDEELEELFEPVEKGKKGKKEKPPSSEGRPRLFGRKKAAPPEPAAAPPVTPAAEPVPPLLAPPLDLAALQEQLLPPEPVAPPPLFPSEPLAPEPAAKPKKERAPKPPKPKKEKPPKAPKPEKAKPSKPPRPARRLGGMTPFQLIVLSALFLMVVGMLALLASTIRQIFTAAPATLPPNGPLIINTPAGTPVEWTGAQLPSPTTAPTTKPPTATPTPAPPTPTPVVLPSVSTRFDLQVLRNPDNVDLRLQRGEEYLRLRAYTLALADFEQARTLSPDRAEAYLGVGQACFYLRRWQEAESSLSSAISFNADLPTPHFWLGRLYYYQGRYELAIRELDQAAELTPYPEAEAWLALTYLRLNPPNLDEANGAVERAFKLDEKLPFNYLTRGWLRVAQQDIEGAQADFLYAQGLAPYDFDVLNMLARFYAEYRPERLAEAERLALQAQNWAQSDLQHALALQTLGRIYLKQGRRETARQVYSQAADLATADGKIALPDLAKEVEQAFAP